MSLVNVTVFVPDSTVKTMADEVADGSVDRTLAAAKAAYLRADSDGNVKVKTYDEDFDNAVDVALRHAAQTDGRDLLVIITDLESNDRPRAEQLLAGLDDDFVVIVPLSNQGYDTTWATYLDDESPSADKIDVVSPADLANESVAYDEVQGWLDAA